MTTSDLITFLNARLDEDEAAAKGALQELSTCGGIRVSDPGDGGNIGHMVAYQFHARRHDPARVLREVEAKRAILERYERASAAPGSVVSFIRGQDDGYRQACMDALRALAAAYSDHAYYDATWKPATAAPAQVPRDPT